MKIKVFIDKYYVTECDGRFVFYLFYTCGNPRIQILSFPYIAQGEIGLGLKLKIDFLKIFIDFLEREKGEEERKGEKEKEGERN